MRDSPLATETKIKFKWNRNNIVALKTKLLRNMVPVSVIVNVLLLFFFFVLAFFYDCFAAETIPLCDIPLFSRNHRPEC